MNSRTDRPTCWHPARRYHDFKTYLRNVFGARVAKLPVIVVAANKLGVINHLLLSLEHASCNGLTLLGYVLNSLTNQPSLAADTNREVLVGLTGLPCLGELPFNEPGAESANLLEAELDLRTIELLLGKL